MKKLLIFCVACLLASNLYGQQNKIAVLNFKANVRIAQEDVNGISSIFTTYFSPRGWILVERTQIDKVISEQGFQKSTMTEAQMVTVGRILNLKKIVIGDVNIISDSYNVDVRIVDVETGVISAKDGASWASETSYRSLMQDLATRLASELASRTPRITMSAPQSQTADVITLYGYLKVFPKNLGVFTSEPTTMITAINKNSKENYGFDTWRLPTQEELEVMLSNMDQIAGIAGNLPYMTIDNRSNGGQKIVRLVTTGKSDDEKAAEQRELERQEQQALAEMQERQQTLGYKIGEYYNVDGKQGIVFEIYSNREYGKHGKIIALKDAPSEMARTAAIDWCDELGDGWKLPSYLELFKIYNVKNLLNDALKQFNGETLTTDKYWSSSDASLKIFMKEPACVDMKDGRLTEFSQSQRLKVRAISEF